MKKDYLIPLIILTGIILRLFVYCSGISFWGDEAALALNVIEKSYSDLFKGLDYLQVAPPMFLVMSKIIMLDSLRDFSLRFIPLVSGIISVPLFYKFIQMLSNSKKVILVSTFLFSFNMTAILYCAQFKQYSLELCVAILLLIIFYKILFQNECKWYYPIIIAISPWFSLSSLFIIGCYFFMVLIKTPKLVLKTYIPFFVSFIIFYFVSLKFIVNANYSGMYNWWQNDYGFVDLRHPLRVIIRVGGLFSFDKTVAIFCGSIILISLIKFDKKKLFLYLPILLTFVASALKLYPIQARLLLFLLPCFVGLIAEYDWKFAKEYLIIVCSMSFITAFYYAINPHNIFFSTYSKEIVNIVENKRKYNEKIILDSSYYVYYYYIKDKSNVILLKNDYDLNDCNTEIENLPSGRYYLISGKDIKTSLTKKVKILDECNLFANILYIEK